MRNVPRDVIAALGPGFGCPGSAEEEGDVGGMRIKAGAPVPRLRAAVPARGGASLTCPS